LIDARRSTFAKAGALCAGLLLVSAFGGAQEVSSGELPALDVLLARDGASAGELGPTGHRLYADELEAAVGVRGRFGFGLTALEWRAPLSLSLLDEERREVEFERVGGTRYPSHAIEEWAGGGLELTERKFITIEDELIVEFELSESTGARDRELLFHLRGDATPWLERVHSKFESVSLSKVDEHHHRELAGLPFASGRLEHDGVVFPLAGGGEASPVRGVGGSALRGNARLPLPDPRPVLATWHSLLAAETTEPSAILFELDDGSVEIVPWPELDRIRSVDGRAEWRRVRVTGTEAELWHLAWAPPPGRSPADVAVGGSAESGPLLLSVVLETPPREGRLPVLLGEIPTTAGSAHVCLAGTEFGSGRDAGGARVLERYESIPAGGSLTLRVALVTGSRILPVLAGALDSAIDESRFDAHVAEYHRWFEEQVPRFSCDDEELEYVWAHSWYRLRRRLLHLGELGYSLPIFREENSAHVDRRSVRSVLAETRWLTDLVFAQGQVRVFMMRQNERGELPTQLPLPPGGWAYPIQWPASLVDVFAVHGSEPFLRESLPLLEPWLKARAFMAPEERDFPSSAPPQFELPGLVRGRRALGEESEALELELRYREEVGELKAGFFHGTTFLMPDVDTATREIADTLDRYRHWRGLETGTPGSLGLLDPRIVSGPDDLIRLVGGLRPRDDGRLELRPRYHELDHFAFEGVHHRDRRLDLYWDTPDGTRVRDSIPEGYTLFVDGAQRFHAETLTDAVLD